MLQLLTTTGCRPEAFSLCQQWMKNQTFNGKVRWVIVDDGESPQTVDPVKNWDIEVARPKPYWNEGENTQKRNLIKGMEYIDQSHPMVIIEDDDYYSPKWLQIVFDTLKEYDLFGEARAKYYNIQTRIFKDCGNNHHASLCSTALKGPAYKTFIDSCGSYEKYIDMKIWKNFTGRKLLSKTDHVIGMKGLPGRNNIGIGHDLKGANDPNFTTFKKLIGKDYSHYLQFAN